MKKLALLAAILSFAASAFAGPYDAWSNYKTITLDASAYTATLTPGGTAGSIGGVTEFPMLVRFDNTLVSHGSDILLNSLTAGGADVVFTDSTGNTALKFERERFTASNAEFWVRVPTVNGSAINNGITKIRVYWGKSGATDISSGSAVFDNTSTTGLPSGTGNGFQAVYHLDGSGNTESNSTAGLSALTLNANNTGVAGTPGAVNGVIAGGRNLNSSKSAVLSATGYATSKGINFPSTTVGYAVGAAGSILKTTDAGLTWTAQTNGGSNWTTNDLNAVACNTATQCVTVGNANTILYTLDGSTWSTLAATGATSTNMNGVAFLLGSNNVLSTATNAFIVGDNGSINKITTFNTAPTFATTALGAGGSAVYNAVACDANVCLVVGDGGATRKLYTTATLAVAGYSNATGNMTTSNLKGVAYTGTALTFQVVGDSAAAGGAGAGSVGVMFHALLTNNATTNSWTSYQFQPPFFASRPGPLYAVGFGVNTVSVSGGARDLQTAGWAVGKGGVVIRSLTSGFKWGLIPSFTTQDLTCMSIPLGTTAAYSQDFGWAGGSSNTLITSGGNFGQYFTTSALNTTAGDVANLNFAPTGPFTLSTWINADYFDGAVKDITNKGDNAYVLQVDASVPGQIGAVGASAQTAILNAYNFAILSSTGVNGQFQNWESMTNGTATALGNPAPGVPLANALPGNGWHMVVATKNTATTGQDPTDSTQIYVDGLLVSRGILPNGPANGTASGSRSFDAMLQIGKALSGGNTQDKDRLLIGSIDEFEYSNANRNAFWNRLAYEVEKPGSTALSEGVASSNGPAITSQPRDTAVTYKTKAAFTVSGSSTLSITTQWFKGAAPISAGGRISLSAAGDTLFIDSVVGADSGAYHATLTTTSGVTASSDARLTIIAVQPGTPPNVVATPSAGGPAQVVVTWGAADDGGAPITSYHVITDGGTGQVCDWASGPLTCTITGLINGQGYHFEVTPVTVKGTAMSYGLSNLAMPTNIPGAPQSVSATAGYGQANVLWSPPLSDSGSTSVLYKASAKTSPAGAPAGTPCTFLASLGGAANCNVTGLTGGLAYTFTVTDSNAVGTGPASAASAPVTILSLPTISFTPSTVTDTVGKAATHTPTTTGTGPISYTVSPALPSGLTINGSTGIVSGTPSVSAGSAVYKVKATNGGGSDSANLTLAVLIPRPTISFSPSTAVDSLNHSVTHTPATSGTIVSCVSTPTLPTGLSIAPTTCIITGTPTVSSSATAYSIKATNGTGSDSTLLTLTVAGNLPTISFSPSTVVDTIGKAASHTPSITGTGVTYTISPALSNGTLALNASTGVVSGTPNATLTATAYKIKATNGFGADSSTLTLSVLIARPTIAFSPSTVTDTVGKAATHTPSVTGTIASCVATPALPSPLLLNNTTCVITGTPTASSASAAYKVKATNSTGSDSATLTLAILGAIPTVSFTPSSVVDTLGKVASHSATVTGTATGCVTSPALPTGLSINNTSCAITGTPSAISSSAAYKIKVSNGTGTDSSFSLTLSVLIAKPTLAFSPTTVIDTVNRSATHTPTLTGTGVTCTVTPALPSTLALNGSTCVITGTPTATLAATAYKVKATNSTGADSSTLTLSVINLNPTIVFTPASVTDTVGKAASHTPSITGTGVTYTISPALSNGTLALNASTGVITGTPTAALAATAYKVKATNGFGADSSTLTLTVVNLSPVLAFNPTTLSDTVGKAATHTPTLTGTGVTCTTVPTLPAGLSISAATCVISGNPTAATASATYKVKATNSFGVDSASVLTLSVLKAKPTLSYTPGTVVDTVNKVASHAATVVGADSCTGVSPALPAGLTLNHTSCAIAGTPTGTASAAANYTVTAMNSTGTTAAVLNIQVRAVVSIRPGSFVIHVNGAAKPYTFSLPANAVTTDKMTMEIMDVYGRTVWSASVTPSAEEGTHELSWNGKTSTGRQASAGMYVVHISVLSGGKTTNIVQKSITLKPR